MSKTKICGPQRIGASAMDEGDLTRAVVASYSALTQDEAREAGQAAAEQILPARRRLWALAERLVPKRLAAALRARCGTDDPTARDGVRALRMALADWLDPPPVCRWCRQPMHEGDTDPDGAGRKCPNRRAWKRDRCVASKTRKASAGPVARCGTLALYSAGQVSLEVMAAALAVPKGAAKGYDVACDRDAKALTVATSDGPPPGRDLDCPEDWQDEALRRMYAAVAALSGPHHDNPEPPRLDASMADRLGLIPDRPFDHKPCISKPTKVPRGDHRRQSGRGHDHALTHDDGRNRGGEVADFVGHDSPLAIGHTNDGDLAAEHNGGLGSGEVGGAGLGGGVHEQDYEARRFLCQQEKRHEQKNAVRTGLAGLPPQIVAAREEWRRLRGLAVVANGRAVLGIQTRYYAPRDGVCRADLVQGAAIGADRGLQDYDATQSRYTTYGADWMRQGCGEAWGDRDLVGTPEWVHALRSKLEDRLPGIARADVLRAIEALADAVAPDATPTARARAKDHAEALARLVVTSAEVRENVLGTRPARYVRRPLFSDQSEDAIDAHAFAVLRAALGKRKKGVTALPTAEGLAVAVSLGDEDPERIRERVADWIGKRLRLAKASGSGLLAALRHGAPVFVQIGAGGDDDDADTQGAAGDGGGGSERMAAVLAAPDDEDTIAEEELGRLRWRAALDALGALQAAGGREAAEVVRRHHGLDTIAEDRGGATGESFASIAASGLASTGRTLTKEGVRKIYNRGLAVMQDYIAGRVTQGDLPALFADDARGDGPAASAADDFGPVRVPRSPWKPLAPAVVAPSTTPVVTTRPVADMPAWEAFRDEAAQVAW